MLTSTWRRFRSPALWALAIALGSPMLADAQQSGLFPNGGIRRERVPCPLEDPIYGFYRQEYFGYHPTCWRRFPAGWGCPSAEAPNPVKAFQERKRDPVSGPPEGEPGEMAPEGTPPGEPAPATPPRPGEELPLPKSTNSPFDLDTKPSDPGPAATPAPAPAPAARGDRPAAAQPPAGLESPPPVTELPTTPPAEPASPPTSRLHPLGAPPSSPDLTLPPVSALPAPANAPVSSTTTPVPFPPAGTVSEPAHSAYATPAAVQAPRRTSLIGSLFGRFRR